jgi:hypothetical protein
MNCALQLNNHGVLSLSKGEDEEFAVSLFTQALGRFKAHVREQIVLTGPASGGAKEAMDCDPSASSGVRGDGDFRVMAMPCSRISPDAHNHIFNRTISICPGNPVGPDYIPVYSSCILVNLAIAYHRMAIKSSSHVHLLRAERLYDMIVRSLIPSHGDATSVAVRTVALNNLADVHHRQSRFDSTERDIARLSSLILQRSRSAPRGDGGGASSSSSTSLLTDSDIDSMILNVLLWTSPQTAAAA